MLLFLEISPIFLVIAPCQRRSVLRDSARVLLARALIARLCALVQPPYFHLTRFHGVFAPNATLRPQIVPVRAPDPELDLPEQLPLFDKTGQRPAAPADSDLPPRAPGRHPWAWLVYKLSF